LYLPLLLCLLATILATSSGSLLLELRETSSADLFHLSALESMAQTSGLDIVVTLTSSSSASAMMDIGKQVRLGLYYEETKS
jgi:hypothetical protein